MPTTEQKEKMALIDAETEFLDGIFHEACALRDTAQYLATMLNDRMGSNTQRKMDILQAKEMK